MLLRRIRNMLRRHVHAGPNSGQQPVRRDAYDEDGLTSLHNHDFLDDPRFAEAYRRGAEAAGCDYHWRWRVHIGLWAASVAARLPGDFVECGVNSGFLASAIMQYLDWNSFDKRFFLLDTFSGIDPKMASPEEIEHGALERNRGHLESGFYVSSIESVRKNFAQWRGVHLIEGSVPHTLQRVTADRVAYLHIDMNCAEPEVAALEYFWDKLAPGAPVLLDDYAYVGFGLQKQAMDRLASRLGVQIASLPTGQGLLMRP
jgi:hypothetical protein